MTQLPTALGVELLKARRSRVPWAAAIAFTMAPLVCGLFMVILKDPEAARSLGLLGTKAALTAGTADWPTFLNMLGQAVAIGSAIVFAFLTAWVFGREFADRTIRNLLASPTSRRVVVLAKAIVVAGWGIVVSAWVMAVGMATGALVGLPGWSSEDALRALGSMGLAAALTIALQSGIALVAGIGRGYIAPLGFAVLTVALAQIVAVLGWGAWFPWSVPAILAGAGGSEIEPVTIGGVLVVLVTASIGLAATVAWWEHADQTG